MDYFLIAVIVLYIFLNLRNELARRWAHRAVNEAYNLNLADIEAGCYTHTGWRYKLIPSHEALMFNLLRWRYRSPFEGK